MPVYHFRFIHLYATCYRLLLPLIHNISFCGKYWIKNKRTWLSGIQCPSQLQGTSVRDHLCNETKCIINIQIVCCWPHFLFLPHSQTLQGLRDCGVMISPHLSLCTAQPVSLLTLNHPYFFNCTPSKVTLSVKESYKVAMSMGSKLYCTLRILKKNSESWFLPQIFWFGNGVWPKLQNCLTLPRCFCRAKY